MAFLQTAKSISFTHHAHEKMAFYRLSEQRVKSVLNSPLRIEEGVAPRTLAMMQPASIRAHTTTRESGGPVLSSFKKRAPVSAQQKSRGFGQNSFSRSASQSMEQPSWSQEIWVMIEDVKGKRTVISAWRYPGVTKPRSEVTKEMMRDQYSSFKKMLK